jgi:hypothetical protein
MGYFPLRHQAPGSNSSHRLFNDLVLERTSILGAEYA